MKKNLASTLALSAAALFLGGCGKDKAPTSSPDTTTPAATADADTGTKAADPNAKQRCYAVNECAGLTACDVAGKWDCAGNNDCCGKGWLYVTKAECDEKGGSDDEALLANPPIECPDKPADAGGAPASKA